MKDLESLICNFCGEKDVSEAKTLIHQYYETVIVPRSGRQNRGTKTLKQKEVSDILDAMKKLDESGPERPIICVAINLINLAHNVSNLKTQVSELMAGQQQLMEMMKTVHVVSDKQAPHKEDSQQTLAPHPEVEQVKQTFVAAVAVPTTPMDISHDQKRTHEWVRVQRNHNLKNRRKANFGCRNHLDLKTNPRRHEFVVFNAPNGCTLEKVKSYSMDNDVDALDIKRLSNEEWNSQSFYFSILFKEEPKVCEPDFWPQNIGYRRFYKQSRSTKQDYNGN